MKRVAESGVLQIQTLFDFASHGLRESPGVTEHPMSDHHRKPGAQDELGEKIGRSIAGLRRADAAVRERERQRRYAFIRAIAEADAVRDHERQTKGESL